DYHPREPKDGRSNGASGAGRADGPAGGATTARGGAVSTRTDTSTGAESTASNATEQVGEKPSAATTPAAQDKKGEDRSEQAKQGNDKGPAPSPAPTQPTPTPRDAPTPKATKPQEDGEVVPLRGVAAKIVSNM